ncbi:MAG: hypothetical protein OIN84_15070 [Candidatus Methanoperedens sp.]|uniref:hypothetical protein n=1 Tax=Candidatus Methanoperedens sp. BLZ2 TaxID=2035255 RepID=UPI0015969997|nr:hypothetical protein [Candidatus Methanoperedens sp. BLZ2]MBZ0175826.1 hypothetical protein [Candidatus Methanoperedens nitroreducens]MCX9079284.1 hypothetical protein [Candidatus Methanoperedens sp.]
MFANRIQPLFLLALRRSNDGARRRCTPPRQVLPIQQGKVTEVGKDRRAGGKHIEQICR